jgi:hypothetical protein
MPSLTAVILSISGDLELIAFSGPYTERIPIAKSESKCKSEIELEGTSEEISVFVDILASFSTLFVARM